jgi:exodeoxyribonuclease VII large subunit
LLIERLERKIFTNYGLIFEKYKTIENKFRISLQSFKNILANTKKNIREYQNNYFTAFVLLCARTEEKIKNIEKVINLNSPERNLKLGYSITTCNGKIIRKIDETEVGQIIDIRVSDGLIASEVKNIKK